MSENYAAVARQLVETSELLLADPSKSETLDLAIACALTEYELGSLYLHALNERRVAARSGRTIKLMSLIVALTRAREVISADASANGLSRGLSNHKPSGTGDLQEIFRMPKTRDRRISRSSERSGTDRVRLADGPAELRAMR